MDTELSTFESLKRHGADKGIDTMAAGTIGVNLNVFEHDPTHIFTSGKALTVDVLDLQAVKEAFSAGIVGAVPLATHAAGNWCFAMRF